jgi:uncharacterized protein YraI
MHKLHFLILIVCFVILTACGQPAATPALIAQAPTQSPTVSPTAAPTATPRPTDPPPTAITIPTNTPEPKPTTPATLAPTDTPTVEPAATPTATATPLPTDSPTPTQPVAVVTGDRLNVRSGPGTVYPVVAQAVKDERYLLLARNEDASWLEVALADGQRGWVSASLVESSTPAETLVVATDIPPTPVPTPTSAVAPTSAPASSPSGPTGQVIGRVLGRDRVPRIGEIVKLTVITLQGTSILETYTDNDGHFVFANVPSGPGHQFMLIAGPVGRAQMVRVNGQLVFTLQPGQTLDVANIDLP